MKTRIFILSAVMFFCSLNVVFALCPVDDVGCLAPYILPLYNNGIGEREWAPVEGKIVSVGNTISCRIKFDSASTYILRTYREGSFGLDIEIVEKYGDDGYSSPRLHLDEVRTTFPSSAKARKDTNFIDFLTNWGSGTENNAVFVRNAEELQPDTYYWVHFIFQENIPDGVTIQPNIQITVDTNWMLILGGAFEFLSESSSWISQSEYYVLETDSYVSFQATQSGSVDVCWESKTTSYLCSESNPIAPTGTEATTDTENGSSATEPISIGPGYETQPTDTEDPGEPNFTIEEVWLETTGSTEQYAYDQNQTIRACARIKNSGDQDCNTDYIKTGFYLSDGYKEDSHSEWVFLEHETTQCYNLEQNETHTECIEFSAPNEPGRIFNIVAEADDTEKVAEKHESDNGSTEAIFSVNSYFDFQINSFSISPSDGKFKPTDTFSATVVAKNNGDDAQQDIQIGYYITGGAYGTSSVLIGTDNIADYNFESGETKEESLTGIQVPSNSKQYYIYACIDYNSQVVETNESNNCLSLIPFKMDDYAWLAPIINSLLQ